MRDKWQFEEKERPKCNFAEYILMETRSVIETRRMMETQDVRMFEQREIRGWKRTALARFELRVLSAIRWGMDNRTMRRFIDE